MTSFSTCLGLEGRPLGTNAAYEKWRSTGLFVEHVIEVELCRIAVFEFGNLARGVLLRLLNLPG